MPERALTPEELAALPPEVRQAMGLSAKPERVATPEEIQAAGLEAPQPIQPRPPPGFFKNLIQQYGAGALKQGLDEATGEIVQRAPGTSPTNETYRKARDAVRSDLEAGSAEYPVSSFMANVGGDVASDAVLKAAGVPVLSGAYQAGVGGLSGLLGGEAELTSDKRTTGDVARAAIDTGVGAGLGYAVLKVAQGAGRVIGPLLRRARAGLENLAVGQGRKVLTNGADTMANRLPLRPDAVLEALRSRAIRMFGTTQGTYDRLEEIVHSGRANYAGLLSELERLGVRGPEAEAIAGQLEAQGRRLAANTGADKAIPNLYLDEAENLRTIAGGGRTLGLQQSEAVKRTLQRGAKYGKYEETPLNEAKRDIASQLRQSIEDAVDDAAAQAPPGSPVTALADEFVPAKRQLGNAIEARDAARRGISRAAARGNRNLKDVVTSAALSGGDPIQMGGWQGLMSAGRSIGPSTISRGAYDLSRAAALGAQGAARNPQAAGLPVAKGAADLSREQLSALIDYLEGPRRKKEKKQ